MNLGGGPSPHCEVKPCSTDKRFEPLWMLSRSLSAQCSCTRPHGIGPVVVDLAAEQVAADAPHMLVLLLADEIFVAHEHVVDVLHLEREVVEAGLLVLHAEEGVVIDDTRRRCRSG